MTGDWIDKSAQPPSKDENGCATVLVWHKMSGVILQHYKDAARNPYITHWMPLPGKPDEIAEGGKTA